jgi:hypothetical protein
MKALGETPPLERDLKGKNKGNIMRALVHASDIGNPTRTFDIAKTWGYLVVKEFLN